VCWDHHPHLVALLATLAAVRREAFADPQPQQAADWTYITLAMFYRDLDADTLATSCRRAGQHRAEPAPELAGERDSNLPAVTPPLHPCCTHLLPTRGGKALVLR